MNEFSVRLDSIANGWATLTFSNTEFSLTLEASYVPNDTLSELLDGAIRLLDGRSSEIKMNLEPQEALLAVTAKDNDRFAATIEDQNFSDSRLRFARQVLKIFDAYSHYHNQEAYALNWHYPFPTTLVERLRQMIDACKQPI